MRNLVFILFLLPLSLVAQPARMGGPPIGLTTSRVYNEAISYPMTDGKTGVTIYFRLPYDQLSFVVNRETGQEGSFLAQVKVNVEFYKDQRRVTDQTFTYSQTAASFDETRSPLNDIAGQLSFALAPGQYFWRMTLNEQPGRLHPLLVPNFSEKVAVSQPFNVSAKAKDQIHVVNLGGDAVYGSTAELATFIQLGDLAPEAAELVWTLHRLKGKALATFMARNSPSMGRRGGPPLGRREDAAEEMPNMNRMVLDSIRSILPKEAEEVAKGSLKGSNFQAIALPHFTKEGFSLQTGASGWYLALLKPSPNPLEDGMYFLRLTLKTPNGQASVPFRFATHWRDMPKSLLSLETATEAMKFIVDKEVLKNLKKGKSEEREAKFKAWWKERDPSPNTEFNELMAEYFRRVDYALVHYTNGMASGGNPFESDRLKIYIQNGAPLKIDRVLPESGGGVREVWRYQDKTFVFEAASSLDKFVLVQ